MIGFLYSLVILPLESLIETLFYFSFDKFSIFYYGGAIVFVSLAVNLATLPVYNMADSLRDKALVREHALSAGVRHIRRTFSGDERFLMLREYYAQNHYSPLSPLLSSLSILIQLPFFIAAYHFLSNCPDLAGASCLFIRDLGQPDGLLSLGGYQLNLLPVLMTLTNILSGAVYARQAPLREKVQLYVLALIFLVLLYASPSGLVLYWLLNNLFSLCKNLAQKHLRHPSVVILLLLDLMAAMASLYTFFIKTHTPLSKKLVVYAVSLLVFCLPLILHRAGRFFARREGNLPFRNALCSARSFSCPRCALPCFRALPFQLRWLQARRRIFLFWGRLPAPFPMSHPLASSWQGFLFSGRHFSTSLHRRQVVPAYPLFSS